MKANLVLASATVILTAATAFAQTTAQPAFPPPKLVAVTDAMRCDWGPISARRSGEIVVNTPAGPFTVLWGDARLVGADPAARVSPSALQPNQNVRVYYVVKDGARAVEIDLIPPPAAVAQ